MANKTEKTVEETTEKMYKVNIPRERGESPYEYVSVNEKNWQIQKGIEVEVPREVYEQLRCKQEMEEVKYRYLDSLE